MDLERVGIVVECGFGFEECGDREEVLGVLGVVGVKGLGRVGREVR